MNRIDRRALFTSGAAAALLAATGVSADALPRRGGRLRVAVARDSGALGALADGARFNTLTEVAPDGGLRGELATSWRAEAGASRWLFDLRDGVTFHNGAGFGASDVVTSLQTDAAFARTGLARLEAIERLVVRIDLKTSNPHLPLLLSDMGLAIRAADGSGTGLYPARRYAADRHFLGERVGHHFKDGAAGWVDSIDAVVIPDAAVRAEALRDGFVDVVELPFSQGLVGRGDFLFRPSDDDIALAARPSVGIPRQIGIRAPMDDGRLAERWWMA